MISREVFEQPDGAHWQIYHINRGFIALTSRGQELLSTRPGVWPALHAYRQAVTEKGMGKTALPGALGTRAYFASGGRSDVYELQPGLAIKEANNEQSVWNALLRMDTLCSVIEGGLPRWLDIPTHYGALVSSNLGTQFLLMQKIDSGLTVQDVHSSVIERHLMSDMKLEQVRREFGSVSNRDHEVIMNRFAESEALLRKGLISNGLMPEDYLPDYHPGNVLVERSHTPVGGSDFKLWVIDQ